MSGNGFANHLRNRLIHKNMSAARIELTDFKSVKQLVNVISGILMSQVLA